MHTNQINGQSVGRYRVRVLAILALLAFSPRVIADDTAKIIGKASVVDGDTLEVGVVRIRLHGIDAPEAGQKCGKRKGGTWRCGDAATGRLAELVQGKDIECTALERDQFGRAIAVCFAGKLNVNARLMTEGLAWAFTRYSDDYVALEAEARAAGLGVWQGKAQAPWEYRANRWARAAEASPRAGCPIKGNISSEGERIYHTPWSPWYSRTKVNEAAGERWFCDEAEAGGAGWRPARWR